MQQSGIAAQTVLSKQDISIGASPMFFAQSLGGAVFVSVSQNIFENRLVSGLVQVGGLKSKVRLRLGLPISELSLLQSSWTVS